MQMHVYALHDATFDRKEKAKPADRHNASRLNKHLLLGDVVNVLSAVGLLRVQGNLDLTLLDVSGEGIEAGLDGTSLPWRKARVKDGVHLLEGLALGLVGHEEHVDEGDTVKGTEDEVHLPVDGAEEWWDGEGKGAVPGPVGAGGDGDSEGTDTERENLGWVGPGDWSPGDGEGGDEEVGAGNDGLGLRLLADEDPGDGIGLDWVWLTVGTLEGTRDEEPNHHGEGTGKESWTTAPFVNPDDGWDGHDDVDNVLDSSREERIIDTSTLHNVDNIVHYSSVSPSASL